MEFPLMTILFILVFTILLLLAGSIILVVRRKTFCALLQLFGTACLMVVLLTKSLKSFPRDCRIVLDIMSVSGVSSLALHCFQWDICAMRSEKLVPNPIHNKA